MKYFLITLTTAINIGALFTAAQLDSETLPTRRHLLLGGSVTFQSATPYFGPSNGAMEDTGHWTESTAGSPLVNGPSETTASNGAGESTETNGDISMQPLETTGSNNTAGNTESIGTPQTTGLPESAQTTGLPTTLQSSASISSEDERDECDKKCNKKQWGDEKKKSCLDKCEEKRKNKSSREKGRENDTEKEN